MEWIPDGYMESRTIGGVLVEYRPLLSISRRALLNRLHSRPYADKEELVRATIAERCIGDSSRVADSHLRELWNAVIGAGNEAGEVRDVMNLRMGTRLQMLYPHTAHFTCDQCRAWYVDPDTGTVTRDHKGDPVPRLDEVPCEFTTCVVGTYRNQRRMSEKNKQAVRFHMECKASRRFPDDEIVRRNARVIEETISQVEREIQWKRTPSTV